MTCSVYKKDGRVSTKLNLREHLLQNMSKLKRLLLYETFFKHYGWILKTVVMKKIIHKMFAKNLNNATPCPKSRYIDINLGNSRLFDI